MTHPALRDLFESLGRDPAFDRILRGLRTHPHQALSGLSLPAKAL
jgi:hypothetical protein